MIFPNLQKSIDESLGRRKIELRRFVGEIPSEQDEIGFGAQAFDRRESSHEAVFGTKEIIDHQVRICGKNHSEQVAVQRVRSLCTPVRNPAVRPPAMIAVRVMKSRRDIRMASLIVRVSLLFPLATRSRPLQVCLLEQRR